MDRDLLPRLVETGQGAKVLNVSFSEYFFIKKISSYLIRSSDLKLGRGLVSCASLLIYPPYGCLFKLKNL